MKYCLSLLMILFFSCNSEPNYNDYLRQMGIVLSDKYSIIKHNSDSAIGDFTVGFQLKISDKDYKYIIAKIKQTENYGEYNKGESPNAFSKIGKGYHIYGFKIADKYFYRKENTSKPIFYELVLGADKTLHYTFAED